MPVARLQRLYAGKDFVGPVAASVVDRNKLHIDGMAFEQIGDLAQIALGVCDKLVQGHNHRETAVADRLPRE